MSQPAFKLLPHQIKPTQALFDMLDSPSKCGTVVIGATGCGKTIVMGMAIKQMQDKGKLVSNPDKPFQLHSVFVIAPTNVIIAHRRRFARLGLKNVEVITGDSLRASWGDMYIKWTTRIVGDRTEYDPVWISESMPDCILVDECQNFKNPNALRTKCLKAYAQQGGKLVFISATPAQKISETELISIACGLAHTDREFRDYSLQISNGDPNANSPTAIKRWQEDLKAKNCWINISNVRYPFKPVIKNYLFDLSPAKRPIYDNAYNVFLEKRLKAGKGRLEGIIAKWNAMREFRQVSELLRADEIANLGHHIQTHENRAIIIGSNFIPTLRSAWSHLIDLGVDKADISFLIGSQNQKDRQINIDKFQAGKSKYFLTTLKSGGTGLDLHHEVPESLPRTVILPPTWSCYEMIQVLGRAQRITNLSAVHQFICWYKDTIEEEVSERLEAKLSCVRELVERKDSFMLDIFNREADRDMTDKLEEEDSSGEEGSPKEETESLFDLDLLDGEQ
jgi:superfamily II DNA or RNA helicase